MAGEDGAARGPDAMVGALDPLSMAEATLRQGAADGRLTLAMLDAWPALAAFADASEASLAEILNAAAALDPSVSVGASASAEGLGFAVVGRNARLRQADERFTDWIGDPSDSVACADLIRRARREGRAVGLVETLDHGVLSVLAKRMGEAFRWPVGAGDPDAGDDRDAVALVAFAPSRSEALVLRSAAALGLSPLEQRLAVALLTAPSLEAAARRLGVGRETAKDALGSAMRKTGAQGSTQLVGRIIDLSCGVEDDPLRDRDLPSRSLGLSPLETQVAKLIADGETAEEAGLKLGLRPGTIKSYRRAIFAKMGINRSRDLRRLMTELGELSRFDQAFEVVSEVASGTLSVAIDASGRRVAAIDYGPARGRPLLLFHGYSTGRLAPPPLLEALTARGYRVIIPQRPGFGLTSAVAGDYLDTAVEDIRVVLDRLGCTRATMLARDGATAVAIEAARRFPDRLSPGVLLNPRAPRDAPRVRNTPIGSVSTMLLRHPDLIGAFSRMMMRQSRRDILAGMFRRVFAAAPADKACFEAPSVADHLIADQRGLVGRSARGFAAELRLFSEGWRPKADSDGPKWTLAFSGASDPNPAVQVWAAHMAGPPVILPDAGLLAQFTHAEALADLIDARG